jgi:EAL domain-containing protein (putative c-di-GMP-specific phosphodiesterase class I)
MMLRVGDIVQIGANQFVVAADDDSENITSATSAMDLNGVSRISNIAAETAALRDLLANARVRTVFEPIVVLKDRPRAIGFEILGRGVHTDAPESPGQLFQLADSVDVADELSRLFRATGFASAAGLPGKPRLFVNTHPAEMGGDTLIRELEQFRARGFDFPLTVEIHETSVLDRERMRELAAALADLDIGFAYDDFGAGQTRLLELVEIPPDYLKFDMSLIRGIDRAPGARVRLLQSLVKMVTSLDIACIAEGIETRAEYSACRDLGFSHAQGFLIGRGQPAEYWQRKAAALAKPDAQRQVAQR